MQTADRYKCHQLLYIFVHETVTVSFKVSCICIEKMLKQRVYNLCRNNHSVEALANTTIVSKLAT